ncbi:hypothetical protein [Paraburkholderia sp. PGU19]|nr:hypothetical protein [Paraburkholderia sp. PGU19]
MEQIVLGVEDPEADLIVTGHRDRRALNWKYSYLLDIRMITGAA